jgi:hypothetical protein
VPRVARGHADEVGSSKPKLFFSQLFVQMRSVVRNPIFFFQLFEATLELELATELPEAIPSVYYYR